MRSVQCCTSDRCLSQCECVCVRVGGGGGVGVKVFDVVVLVL